MSVQYIISLFFDNPICNIKVWRCVTSLRVLSGLLSVRRWRMTRSSVWWAPSLTWRSCWSQRCSGSCVWSLSWTRGRRTGWRVRDIHAHTHAGMHAHAHRHVEGGRADTWGARTHACTHACTHAHTHARTHVHTCRMRTHGRTTGWHEREGGRADAWGTRTHARTQACTHTQMEGRADAWKDGLTCEGHAHTCRHSDTWEDERLTWEGHACTCMCKHTHTHVYIHVQLLAMPVWPCDLLSLCSVTLDPMTLWPSITQCQVTLDPMTLWQYTQCSVTLDAVTLWPSVAQCSATRRSTSSSKEPSVLTRSPSWSVLGRSSTKIICPPTLTYPWWVTSKLTSGTDMVVFRGQTAQRNPPIFRSAKRMLETHQIFT